MEMIDKYKTQGGSLVGLLQDVSKEMGYLSVETLQTVSKEAEVPLSLLYSLATFYSSFRLKPLGRHHVCVCVGTACHVKGATPIVDTLERELNVKASETAADNSVTLETVSCLGACALSPLVVIDGEYHGKMDSKTATKLIKQMKEPDQE